MKDRICIDFDGVLHSYISGWKGADTVPDPPFPGAMEALRLYTRFFTVAIFSSRSGQSGGIDAMKWWVLEWAEKERLGTAWVEKLEWPTVKPPAKVSLDDRCICFTGVWPTVQELRSFEPFYKKPLGAGK